MTRAYGVNLPLSTKSNPTTYVVINTQTTPTLLMRCLE